MGIADRDVACAEALVARGWKVRRIAREIGVSESSLRYRLNCSHDPSADGRKHKREACEAYAKEIRQWLAAQDTARRPDSVRSLFEHLVHHCGFRGTYKSVLRYVNRRRPTPRQRPVRRVETAPGAQAQVDWVESEPICVEELGGAVRLQAFVMTLSHSRMWAVVWSVRQDLSAWLDAHNRALAWLGGVPAVIRIDNLKTGVASGAGVWARLQAGYASYAKEMGFAVDPCRVRRGQDKGKVERRGRDVKRFGIGSTERFASLAELQAQTDQRIVERAKRLTCPVTGRSIHATGQAERRKLQDLPRTLPEPFDVQVRRKVSKDCLVPFEGRQYSVPFPYTGRAVQVRGAGDRVQIYHDQQQIAQFPRGTACRLLIDQRHYDGESTETVHAPSPLGRMGQRIVVPRSWELSDSAETHCRGIDHYASLIEGMR